MQYEPTPLTEKKVDGFMAFLTNEPFLVKQQGFTPVTLAFADNGLPLASETLVVLQDTIDKDRDKLKAFLKAEIQGWNDAVADPAAVAKLAVETYGKDLKLDLAGQTEQAKAQNELVMHRRDRRPTGCSRSATPRWRRTSSRSARWASPSPPTSSSTSAWSRRSTPRTRA